MSNFQYGIETHTIKMIDDSFIKDEKLTLNTIHCSKWIIIDEVNLKEVTINWPFTGIKKHREIFAKEFIRAVCGKGNVAEGVLYSREKTIKNHIALIKSLLNTVDNIFGIEKRLDQLELVDVRRILIFLVKKPDGGLWSSGTIKNHLGVLSKSAKFHDEGLITDGISCQLPRLKSQLALIKPYIEATGIEYHEWEKEGTWHNLSMDIALLVVEHHISIVEAPLANFLADYFNFQRSEYRVDPDKFIRPGRFTTEFSQTCKKAKLLDSACNENKSNLQRLADIFVKHGLINADGSPSDEFKPKTLYRPIQKIKASALFVFTALSGIRISEVASVRYSNFERKHGVIYFTSNLEKTNRGIPISRSISKNAFQIIEIAAFLSYLPLDSDVSPFAFTYGRSSFTDQTIKSRYRVPKEDLAKRITSAYKDWVTLNRDQFPECPKTSSPHSLRHIFAAISLKVFSGDVRNHIRRHFGHSPGSNFTKNYIEGKLDDVIVSSTESDFFKKFVESIGADDPEFFAAIAKRIRERISDNHVFQSPSELSDYLALEAIETCQIIGHEFGYSIPWDKKDLQITMDTHHLTKRSEPEEIVRIGISHQHLLDECSNDEIREASESIIAMCEQMLSELNIDLTGLRYD